MMSSSIFFAHGSMPPKSTRHTAGDACSFAPATRLCLVLPSSPRVEGSLCLLDGAVVIEGTLSAFLEEGGTGSGHRGSSEGVEVSTWGGPKVGVLDNVGVTVSIWGG
jgi:hypothetical protein